MDRLAMSAVLGRLLAARGHALCEQPEVLRGLLLDEMPTARRDVAALVLAVTEGLVAELRSSAGREPILSLVRRLAVRLSTDHPIALDQALSTLAVWAHALDLAPATLFERLDGAGQDDQGRAGANGEEQGSQADGRRPPAPGPDRIEAWRARVDHALAVVRTSPRLLGLCLAGAAGVVALLAYLVLRPPGSIQAVDLEEPFMADGKPRKVVVVTGGTRLPVARIRMDVLKGNWAKTSWTVDVPEDQSRADRIPVGSLRSEARQDSDNEFAYVLVFADGSQSKPFVKSFKVQAVPITPPKITSVSASGPFVVGRETAIRVAFVGGGADVAKIRRKVVSADVAWNDPQGRVIAPPGLAGKASGVAEYTVSPGSPGRAVFEFTLIDSDGRESAPSRFEFEVLPAGAPVPLRLSDILNPKPGQFPGLIPGGQQPLKR